MRGIDYRQTRPCSPQQNGMVERFNRRVGQTMLTITVGGHGDLEHLLLGYTRATSVLASPRHEFPDPAIMSSAMRAGEIARTTRNQRIEGPPPHP